MFPDGVGGIVPNGFPLFSFPSLFQGFSVSLPAEERHEENVPLASGSERCSASTERFLLAYHSLHHGWVGRLDPTCDLRGGSIMPSIAVAGIEDTSPQYRRTGPPSFAFHILDGMRLIGYHVARISRRGRWIYIACHKQTSKPPLV